MEPLFYIVKSGTTVRKWRFPDETEWRPPIIFSLSIYPNNKAGKFFLRKYGFLFFTPFIIMLFAMLISYEYSNQMNEFWFGVALVAHLLISFLIVFFKIKPRGSDLPNDCYDPPKI